MLVAVLAIHQAGGAYLPLDPDFPADRIAYMIEDSGLDLILSESSIARALPATGAEVILVDREGELDTLTIEAAALTGEGGSPEDLAEVLCLRFKAHLGVTCRVQLVAEDRLPRSEGKARRVWDLRK